MNAVVDVDVVEPPLLIGWRVARHLGTHVLSELSILLHGAVPGETADVLLVTAGADTLAADKNGPVSQ